MKTLIFKDGTDVNFSDVSTILDCVLVATSFAEVDEVREKFTEENLKGAKFEGERVENIVPTGVSAQVNGNNIVAHFTSTQRSEVDVITEQIVELQLAIADIMSIIITPPNLDEPDEEEEEVADNV